MFVRPACNEEMKEWRCEKEYQLAVVAIDP